MSDNDYIKKTITQHRILIGVFCFFLVTGTIYSITIPKLFTSKSQVVIFRPKLENPDAGFEESRNRWIWIRDGLNQKSALVTDVMLRSFLNNATNEQAGLDHIKSMINIQYTGADENNFIIEVKAPEPQLAFELNKLIFKRIKFLAVDIYQENFNKVLFELKNKQEELRADKNTYQFYQDKIQKLIFNQTLEQKQRENSFEVISTPTINNTPAPSKAPYIIILSVLTGLIIGMYIEYLLSKGTKCL
jgi:hypothetical protein